MKQLILKLKGELAVVPVNVRGRRPRLPQTPPPCRQFGECLRRAGLRRISWHVLRHTFASRLTMRGVPLKAVQELLGHATIEMTMRDAHLSPTVTRNAVQVLDQPAPAPLGNQWATASDSGRT